MQQVLCVQMRLLFKDFQDVLYMLKFVRFPREAKKLNESQKSWDAL